MPALAEQAERSTTGFPPFTQNMLRIKVPVMVTLARTKQPVQSIVELVPGSIIQFSKSCDEMLELEVSGEPIAQGECVKVGDKFGLRITSMILPAERFRPVRPQ
jgi:flagellar motor switch protein FliN/FliY